MSLKLRNGQWAHEADAASPEQPVHGELGDDDTVTIRAQLDAVGTVQVFEQDEGALGLRLVHEHTSRVLVLEHWVEDLIQWPLGARLGEEDVVIGVDD